MFFARHTLVLVLFAPLVAASTGCVVVESKHPLSDEKTSVIDERLLGTWQMGDMIGGKFEPNGDIGVSRGTISKHPKLKNALELKLTGPTKDGKQEELAMTIFCTTIGKHRYLSVYGCPCPVDGGGTVVEGYIIGRYEWSKEDRLVIHWMHGGRQVEESVKNKKLEGTLVLNPAERGGRERSVKEIKLTDSPENLRLFVEQDKGDEHGSVNGIFSPFDNTFQRVKSSEPPSKK